VFLIESVMVVDRARTGSCSRGGGTKACRERLRREKLNERYV